MAWREVTSMTTLSRDFDNADEYATAMFTAPGTIFAAFGTGSASGGVRLYTYYTDGTLDCKSPSTGSQRSQFSALSINY